MLYQGDPSAHLPMIASTFIDQLKSNYRCLYLNSPAMVAGMRTHLAAGGIDVAEAVELGLLVLSSDQSHLVKGEFDADRMLANLSDAVDLALEDGYDGLWAAGDVWWELDSERNLPKLLAYEARLEELSEAQPALRGICQYRRDMMPVSALQVALYKHKAVFINQTLTLLNRHYLDAATLRHDGSAEVITKTLDGFASRPD